MRILTIILLIGFGLWACEWAPEQVEVYRSDSFQQLKVVVGLKTSIDVQGSDFSIESIINNEAVEITSNDSGHFELTGKVPGLTEITINYFIDGESNSDGGHDARLVLDIEVSNGLPLDIYIEDTLTIDLASHIDSSEWELIDSVEIRYTGGSTSTNNIAVFNSEGLLLELEGLIPGREGLFITFFHAGDTLSNSIVFELTTRVKPNVLAEIYTNAGCRNCPEANHNIDLLYEEFPDNFTAIRYHVWWTDLFDPMNLYNPTEVEDRRVFSGNSYEAPKIYLDGESISDYSDYSGLVVSISQNINAGTDVHIWKPSYVETVDSLFIDYKVENFGTALSDLLCYSVLTQDSIYYEGSNGEIIHMQVMRDITSTSMSELSGELNVSHSLKRVPDFENNDNLHLVLFVQDMSSKTILQVTEYSVSELLP